MFDLPLDSERLFEQDRRMSRTGVRGRRRLLGSFLAVVLAMLMAAPVATALGRRGSPAHGRAPVQSERVYVVRSGDTVWSIAERITPGDPTSLVDAIAVRNGIDVGDIVPGQSIVIPSIA
jgi:nucleoid-associated protein YgaU